MIESATGFGLLASLVAFLKSEMSGRRTKEEILAALDEAATIESYKEWLRRKDQESLLKELESSKTQLMEEIALLGVSIHEFGQKVWNQSEDLRQRLSELNNHLHPPVLSRISLPTRRKAGIPLKGRAVELTWLIGSTSDVILYGQPGSGKTELLEAFAADEGAWFLLTTNSDAAVTAIVGQNPMIVIVDDAGSQRDLIIRLRHLRRERNLSFRIVASCWPFDMRDLQHDLQIPNSSTLALEGLPIALIAEIIQELTKAKGVTVNDAFIRVVARQARGMPGLATSLSLATLAASGEELVSGELLLRDLSPFLRRHVGPDAVDLLAAFACGGNRGISIGAVAKVLGKEILQVKIYAERTSLAGVLEQVDRDILRIQPEFLRSALIKEAFFPVGRPGLPWEICTSLIESSRDPVLGYAEIVHASSRAGADVPLEELRAITKKNDDLSLWEVMADLNQRTCAWVLESKAELSPEIKRSALRLVPEQVIPRMLDSATGDSRPLNAYPDADLRILEDWVTGGWHDAVDRRQKLLNTALDWMSNGGDVAVTVKTAAIAFSLRHKENDSDPANPNLFRFREAVLSLEMARQIFEQWESFSNALKGMDALPWAEIFALVQQWRGTRPMGSKKLPDDFQEFLRISTERIVCDLVPLAANNQAALRWLYLAGKRLETSEPIPVQAEFMVLFPERPWGDEREDLEQKQRQAAEDLAECWKDRPFADIVRDLVAWQKQMEALGPIWPQLIPVFAEKLAEIRSLSSQELEVATDGFSAEAVRPFWNHAVAEGNFSEHLFSRAMARTDLHGLLIAFAVTGKTPSHYGDLEPHMPNYQGLIGTRCLRGEVSQEILQRLLQHENTDLRGEVALEMFRADGNPKISPALHEAWRTSILELLVKLVVEGAHYGPHDLEEILQYDDSIAESVVEGLINAGDQHYLSLAEEMLAKLVDPLSREQRKALLLQCKHLPYSPLPGLLVGADSDIFREMLGLPELRACYPRVLADNPENEEWKKNWIDLAQVALGSGLSPTDIAHAMHSNGFGWSGHLSSLYQRWIDRYNELSKHSDPGIRQVASEGIKWATANRDRERQSERREEIYGRD